MGQLHPFFKILKETLRGSIRLTLEQRFRKNNISEDLEHKTRLIWIKVYQNNK